MDVTDTIELRRALERELALLQQALVPPLPSAINGCHLASVYLPGHRGADIGGDLYDVFTTEDGQIALLIGDVAGKGIEAASLAAAARSTVHSFAYDLSSPGLALSHASAALQMESDRFERFVTAFLAIMDPASGQIRYSTAGHPPAAIWRRSGRVDFLMCCGGPPIGALDGAEYPEYEDALEPGDKIALYTDGVLEARRGAELFEIEGVERTLAEYGQRAPDEVASGLLESAREWAGGPLRDDAAIIVLECPTTE